MLGVLAAKGTGQALILLALMTQAFLSPDSSQVLIQGLIFGGIVVQAGITILTHRWDSEDRARKQKELLAKTVETTADVKREVVATTQLQLSATNTATGEIKAAVSKANGEPVANEQEAEQ